MSNKSICPGYVPVTIELPSDLAAMYGVETKVLNKAVKRNIERFPERFMFQLTKEECLRFQSGTLNVHPAKQARGQHLKYLPYVFTEQGVSMLSAVLRSPTAVQVCITIMDAFVRMRNYLATAPDALSARLESIDRRLQELEQTRIAGELGPAPEAPLPERLSDEVRVVDYSARAVVVFTENRQDRRLLKWLGARYNCWLTWKGERVAGWVYPKSCLDKLMKYLPETNSAR